jgi:dephospho-CoA kinase
MTEPHSSDELQLQRLMLRDNSSREEATSRLNAQIPISQKVSYADYVIDNSGTKQELEANIDRLIRRLNDKAGWSWRLSWIPPIGILMAGWTLAWKNLMKRRNGT